jgi:hypothetical protein
MLLYHGAGVVWNKGDYDILMWFFKAFHFTFSSLEWVVSLIVHDVILSSIGGFL